MGGVGDGHPLLAALGLHGGDVEHKVRADDAGARLPGPHHPAVLPEGVTDTAHVQVLLRDFDLAAHGDVLALVLAVRVAAVRLEEHLVLLTFSERARRENKLLRKRHHLLLAGEHGK